MEGGAALRGALGASCGGRDCCAHGGGGAAAAGGAVGGWEASPGGAGGAHHAAGGLWRDSLPWLCDLGDGAGEPLREGGLEGGDAFFAALASCGAGGASPAGGPLGEADLDGWLCKHVHTTAPSEQPGGAPQTTCHHTHVRVCKPQRARRGASGGGGPAASKAHAPQPQPQPGASRAEAPKNEGSAGDTAAAAEDGESSGGDDAPLERKRNREAVRKYRARKKEEEGRAAAELGGLRAQVAALSSDNARLRALLAQIGGLAAAGGFLAPPPPRAR